MEQLGFLWTDFNEIDISFFFFLIFHEEYIFIKIRQE